MFARGHDAPHFQDACGTAGGRPRIREARPACTLPFLTS